MRNAERSNSPLETKQLYEQSKKLFSGVVHEEPAQLWETHRYKSLQAALENVDGDFDPSAIELVKHGASDVYDAVEAILLRSNFTGSIEERIRLVTHPQSVLALGALAARREESMRSRIEQIGVAPVSFLLGAENFSASYDLTRTAASSIDDARCPFAGLYDQNGEIIQQPAPVFKDFAKWSAELAVYYDSESYDKRHGL